MVSRQEAEHYLGWLVGRLGVELPLLQFLRLKVSSLAESFDIDSDFAEVDLQRTFCPSNWRAPPLEDQVSAAVRSQQERSVEQQLEGWWVRIGWLDRLLAGLTLGVKLRPCPPQL